MSFSAFVRTHNPLPSSSATRVPKKKAGVFQVGDKVRVVENPDNHPSVSDVMGLIFFVEEIDGEAIYTGDNRCRWLYTEEVEHV